MSSLVEIGQMVLEKIFKFHQYNLLLERASFFIWRNMNLFYSRMLTAKIWLKLSPLGKGETFTWTNLNSLHLRVLCTKFGWKWPSGSWEEEEENVKSLQWQQDKFQSEKLTWAFSSCRLKKAENWKIDQIDWKTDGLRADLMLNQTDG